jgi:tetratricopeptide (TPR) repeat protein
LGSVGWHLALQRDYPEALRCCRQALELCRELDYKIAEGHAWHSLGFIHLQVGEPGRAISCYGQARDTYAQVMDRYYESQALTGLGDARLSAGERAQAREAWRQALAILEDLHHSDADGVRAKLDCVAVPGHVP